MIKERARIIATIVFGFDLLAVAAAFFAAYWLRSHFLVRTGWVSGAIYPLEAYLPLLPLALSCWGVALLMTGRYRSARTDRLPREALRIVRACLVALALFVLAIYILRLDAVLLGDDQISRLWILLLAGTSVVLLLASRLAVRVTSHQVRARGYNYRTVLVVGTSASAQSIAASFEAHPYWGYKLLGFVSDGTTDDTAPAASRILGTFDDIPRLIEENVVDEVVFAIRRRQLDQMENLFLLLEEQGVHTQVALDIFPQTRARVGLTDLDGIPMISYSSVPMSQFQGMVKRLVDILIAACLLAVTAPLTAAAALAILFSSRGPVLFRQIRCGLSGREFTLLKFRTMVADAEARRSELLDRNEMDGPVFKVSDDPRVTLVGRFLRRFSLDELPQLWNVLRGDMSMVGPRPPIPAEVREYERWQRRRLSMRPGITCLWQVRGRNRITFERWMEMDLEYIDSWSPLLDAKILLRTIPVVLSGRGAS